MGPFQAVYSDEQRAAIEQAWCERHVRPAQLVVDLAARGELTAGTARVPAFTTNPNAVRDIGRRYNRSRKRAAERAAALEPADAVELYRRRLSSIIDEAIRHVERKQQAGRHDRVNLASLTQIGRAVRELAAIPGKGKTSANLPQSPVKRTGTLADRPGLAEQLRATMQPAGINTAPAATEPSSTQPLEEEQSMEGYGEHAQDDAHGATEADLSEPGQYARARIAGLRGQVTSVRPAP